MSVAADSSKREGIRLRSRRLQTRRSFFAILSGAALFVALQVGLVLAIEFVLPEVRDPLYGLRLHFLQKALHARPTKPWTVVMLGTSRMRGRFPSWQT